MTDGNVAKDRAQSPEVRKLAAHMVADHTKANKELGEIGKKMGLGMDFNSGKARSFRKENFDGDYLATMESDHKAALQPKPRMAELPLVFMHIPKTAGTAVTAALSASLSPRHFVSGFDRVLFGEFNGFDTIDPALRQSIYLESKNLPANGNFVSGHISFSTLRHVYPVAQYFTVLREPVSRLLSFWLYWRSQTESQLCSWGDWASYVKQSRGPVGEFLCRREIACTTDNLYVRMLVWPHPLIPENDFIDPRHDKTLVRLALDHLGKFAFCDIVENPNLQANIQKWLQRPFSLGVTNETSATPGTQHKSLHEELTPEVHRALEERTRLDLKIWAAAARQVGIADPESLCDLTLAKNIERHQRAFTAAAGS